MNIRYRFSDPTILPPCIVLVSSLPICRCLSLISQHEFTCLSFRLPSSAPPFSPSLLPTIASFFFPTLYMTYHQHPLDSSPQGLKKPSVRTLIRVCPSALPHGDSTLCTTSFSFACFEAGLGAGLLPVSVCGHVGYVGGGESLLGYIALGLEGVDLEEVSSDGRKLHQT